MGHEDLIEHARMQLRGHNLPDAVADLLKLAEHHGRMLEAYAAKPATQSPDAGFDEWFARHYDFTEIRLRECMRSAWYSSALAASAAERERIVRLFVDNPDFVLGSSPDGMPQVLDHLWVSLVAKRIRESAP